MFLWRHAVCGESRRAFLALGCLGMHLNHILVTDSLTRFPALGFDRIPGESLCHVKKRGLSRFQKQLGINRSEIQHDSYVIAASPEPTPLLAAGSDHLLPPLVGMIPSDRRLDALNLPLTMYVPPARTTNVKASTVGRTPAFLTASGIARSRRSQ